MALITLLTDFGISDEYVGVLKGVIIGINPNVTIVDITHGIEPQNVTAAAYTLKAAFPFFPEGTIHLAVVDPGVGTQRWIVAAKSQGHFFVAPDNGLLAPIFSTQAPEAIYRVENERLFRHPVSRTFHGRDIFAPVAAHLSKGIPLRTLGRAVSFHALRILGVQAPGIDPAGILVGEVVGVDRFGNLITNISDQDLLEMGEGKVQIIIGDHVIEGLADSYTQGPVGGPAAIIGSRGCLEIFLNGGNAAEKLQVAQGQNVNVRLRR